MVKQCDALYWIMHPLDSKTVAVLRRIQRGHQAFDRDNLAVAYLIAVKCVRADLKRYTLAITEKGEDALVFYEAA